MHHARCTLHCITAHTANFGHSLVVAGSEPDSSPIKSTVRGRSVAHRYKLLGKKYKNAPTVSNRATCSVRVCVCGEKARTHWQH